MLGNDTVTPAKVGSVNAPPKKDKPEALEFVREGRDNPINGRVNQVNEVEVGSLVGWG